MSVWWLVPCSALSFYAGALLIALLTSGRDRPRGGYVPRDVLRSTNQGTERTLPLVGTFTGCSPDGRQVVELASQVLTRDPSKPTGPGFSGTATDGHRGVPATPAGFRTFKDVIRMPTSTMDEKLAKAQAFADALDAKQGTSGWAGEA